MFEQTFKNIDDILHKDAGCGSELDYVEQTSWVLFLKYLDDLEKDKKTASELTGKTYTNIIAPEYQWSTWATPKLDNGKIDHNALTGDDLKDFVDHKLFPYLKKFTTSAESADTIEYKIGEIFSELKNRIHSGYNLREVINLIDELRFRTHAEKHEMSHLYESKIQNMGNAGRNGGEYYTPRPLITTIVKVVAPKIGDKIYDGAVGSAGFLCEAFDYLKNSKSLTTKDVEILQKKTFYGKEKKSLAYIIGTMNLILHGVEAPNIVHTNTLAENLADIQEKDRYDIVLANPPFGGKERAEVQQNFPIKTGETASLFLQHFIKILKAGGRGGVVIKNTFLSNTDNASVSLRKLLLENCNLHTVLDLPAGTFTGAGVKTVVLFFEKGTPTRKVWFYQLNLDRNLGKTNALSEKDLADFVTLQKTKAESENSWSVDVKDIGQNTFDLSAKNPNKKEEDALRSPEDILKDMKALDKESEEILKNIHKQSIFSNKSNDWEEKTLGELYHIGSSRRVLKSQWKNEGVPFYRGREITKLAHEGFVNNDLFISEEHYLKLSKLTGVPTADDIVITAIGTIGNAYIVKNTDRFYFKDASVLWMKKSSEINSEFIRFWLKSSLFFNQLDKGNGATVDTLTIQKLQSVRLFVPSLKQQEVVVKKLNELYSELKRLETINEQKTRDLEEFKNGVLNFLL